MNFALLKEVFELVEDAESMRDDFFDLVGSELPTEYFDVLRNIVNLDFEDVEKFFVVG